MRLKDIRKGPLFVLLFGLLVVIGIGLYVGGVFGKDTLYGRGKSIEVIGSDTLSSGGITMKVNGGGYFNGSLDGLLKHFPGERSGDGYFVFDVSFKNTSDLPVTVGDVDVASTRDIYDVKGTALVSTFDSKIDRSIPKKVAKEYRLVMNGDTILPRETIRGALYIGVKGLDRKKAVSVLYRGGGNEKAIKVDITRWNFEDDDLMKVNNIFDTKVNKLSLGDLRKGKQVKVEERTVNSEGLSMTAGNAYYFDKYSDKFSSSINHLVSTTTREKVLLVDMTIQNVSKDDKQLGDFTLKIPRVSGKGYDVVESVRTMQTGSMSNSVDGKFGDTYSLLNYPGFGPGMKPLKAGETVKGRVLFYSSSIVPETRSVISYKPVGKSKVKSDDAWSVLMN